MIANQVLQTNIEGMKNITRVDICVMDTEGKALATTIDNVEEYEEAVWRSLIRLQIVRYFRDINFSRSLMITN